MASLTKNHIFNMEESKCLYCKYVIHYFFNSAFCFADNVTCIKKKNLLNLKNIIEAVY